MLSRILIVGLLAGFVSGVTVTGLHMAWTVPLIIAAEEYEEPATPAPAAQRDSHMAASHDHAAHGHDHGGEGAWAPRGGAERAFWTLVTNVILGVGAGLLIAAAFALRRTDATLTTGLVWGGLAFLSLSLAPAIGLPPELPGDAAAALEDRQVWWALTAACTAGGLAAMILGGRAAWLVAGALLLALPHVIGAPVVEDAESLAPATMRNEFILAGLVTSALFWLVLGGAVGALARRFRLVGDEAETMAT